MWSFTGTTPYVNVRIVKSFDFIRHGCDDMFGVIFLPWIRNLRGDE